MVDILLIEDNKKARELYQSKLESIGLKVDTAIDGFDAYKKLQANSYKLILLDIMVTAIDGETLSQKLKLEAGTSKFMIFTNLSKEALDKQQKDHIGVDYFINSDNDDLDQFVLEIKKVIQ